MKGLQYVALIVLLFGCTSVEKSYEVARVPASTKNYSQNVKSEYAQRELAGMKLLFEYARKEPYQFFKHLRENDPFFTLPTGDVTLAGFSLKKLPNLFVFSKYKHVDEVLQRNEDFQVIPNREKMNNSVGPYMLAYEETASFGGGEPHPGKITPHTRMQMPEYTVNFRDEHNKMWDMMIDRPEDQERIRQMAYAVVDRAVKAQKANAKSPDQIDVVKTITRDVPVRVVRDYFGFNPIPANPSQSNDAIKFFSRWTQNSFFHNPFGNKGVDKMAVYAAIGPDRYKKHFGKIPNDPYTGSNKHKFKGMADYIPAMLERRRQFLASNGLKTYADLQALDNETVRNQITTIDHMLLASAFHKKAGVNEERLISNVMGLLVGAIETGSAAIAQSLEFFMENPAMRDMLIEAANNNDQARVRQLVWEALRFNPINPWVARIAVRNTTLDGVSIPAGSLILASTESAMMDPEVFNNPRAFRSGRDLSKYMHMGAHRHICLGYDVADVFVPSAVSRMITQLPYLRKNEPFQKIKFKKGIKDSPFPEAYPLRFGEPKTVTSKIGQKKEDLGLLLWIKTTMNRITDQKLKTEAQNAFDGFKSKNKKVKFDSIKKAPGILNRALSNMGATGGDLYVACMDVNNKSGLVFPKAKDQSAYCSQPLDWRVCFANEIGTHKNPPVVAYDNCMNENIYQANGQPLLNSFEKSKFERDMPKDRLVQLFTTYLNNK